MKNSRHFKAQERRIILALLIVLFAIQVLIYLASARANRLIVEQNLSAQLTTTSQVLDQLLELRQRQLAQGARVLAADYGLKEAIAIGERGTIESMLRNHGQRLQADIALLTSLDRKLLASVPTQLQPADIAPLLKAAQHPQSVGEPVHFNLLRSEDGALYQLIHSRVSMPTPQAELTLGFAINNALAAELARVTNTEFAFLSRGDNGAWQLHANTLEIPFERLLSDPAALQDNALWALQELDSKYLMRSSLLTSATTLGASEVLVIMGKSLNAALAPYEQTERTQLYLLGLSLLLSAAAVLLINRHLLRPLNTMAHQDALTGLPNRRLFDQSMSQALNSRRRNTSFALVMIDLDHFKQINDQYGHAAGDAVLKVSAERLRGLLRRIDMPARLGGDEFAVLLPGLDRAAAIRLAERIEQTLSEPITFKQQTLQIGISIGIAIAPNDGSTVSELLQMADSEMYADKAQRDGL